MNLFDAVNNFIRNTEASLVNLLSSIAPWCAPLAPAYMSYQHMIDSLFFPQWVAVAIALVVEILGLTTISTGMEFWQHNRRHRARYKQAPVMLVVFTFVFYLATILIMNVALDSSDSEWVLISARASLTLLSIPAALILALRTRHTILLSEMRRSVRSPNERTRLRNEGSTEVADSIVRYVREHINSEGEYPGPTQVAKDLGCSKSYASDVMRRMKDE